MWPSSMYRQAQRVNKHTHTHVQTHTHGKKEAESRETKEAYHAAFSNGHSSLYSFWPTVSSL